MLSNGIDSDTVFTPRTDLKRRRFDDDDEINLAPRSRSKRLYVSNLAFRSPPAVQRPSISVTPAFAQFSATGTLTPESLSEDEYSRAEESWMKSQLSDLSQHQSRESDSSNDSDSSLLVQVDTNDSNAVMMDTDAIPISPIQRHRIGRARSNDLMSPVQSPATSRSLSLLSPPSMHSSADRMPTPVTASFGLRSPFGTSFSSAAARQLRPQAHHTVLSPMTDAESWTPQVQRPPSPEPDAEPMVPDQDTMMMVEDANSSFGALSVNTGGDVFSMDPDSSPSRRYNVGLGLGQDSTDASDMGSHSKNDSRTARLRMGFRADCEKCVQRVPGHYAHIDWS